MDTADETVVVGEIMGVHGVRGWVKVYSRTEPRDNILSYRPWWLEIDGRWQEVTVDACQRQGKNIIARLNGCVDRDEARDRFVGSRLAIPVTALPELPEDEYYWRDLLQLRVILEDGRDLGEVSGLMETGANDVLVVQGDAQSLDRQERLIPWLPEQVIVAVDQRAVTVSWDPEF